MSTMKADARINVRL
jgi:uncharacterized protein (DUF1778 family)